MKNKTKRLCRAGVIAALYAALTYVFTPFAFGPLQIRPAEALCLLPLLFPEAIPALWVGCMISNLASPYVVYDVTLGSLATLISAFISYMVGRFCKKEWLRVGLGGFFPVAINALVLPLIIVFLCGDGGGYQSQAVAYWTFVTSTALTQVVWVYALGVPLYFAVKKPR